MRPIDFEDARDMMREESLVNELHVIMAAARMRERQRAIEAHNRWQYHWRTRLSNWLRSLASKVELPEPKRD